MIEGNQILIIFIKNILQINPMLLAGFIAIIQTVFIPGFLILNFFRIRTTSLVQRLVFIFGLSLFINYALVTILILLNIYYTWIMILILVSEIVLIIFLFIKNKLLSEHYLTVSETADRFFNLYHSNSKPVKILFIFSLLVILFYSGLFIANLGTVFYFVDTVNNIHWNTWAIDLANNSFPVNSSHFPQLIPANWSISYLLAGEPYIHFFPKSIMPLFFLANILMFWDLAIEKQNRIYFIALIIYGMISPIVYNLVFIADGNGDLPVSFFTFLTFYTFLKFEGEFSSPGEIIILFLWAASAPATKLAGFYVFVFFSLYCLYSFIKNIKHFSPKKIVLSVSFVIIISVISFFWYLIKPKTMASGLNQPEWLPAGYYNIFINAVNLIYNNIGLPVLAFLIITIIFSLFVKRIRLITFVFVIPPILLWMFKYSSDFRNLSFVIPILSLVSAFGFNRLFEIASNKKSTTEIELNPCNKPLFDRRKNLYLLILSVTSLLLFFFVGSDKFYGFLYSTYEAINKYYFLSNRITYLVDYTFFLPVDYYQRTIQASLLIILLINLTILLKLKIRYFLVMIPVAVLFLNFTIITPTYLKNYQLEQYCKVDARNYYSRLKPILISLKCSKPIITNFNCICNEKIQRDFAFSYKNNDNILHDLIGSSLEKDDFMFLKTNTLTNRFKTLITEMKSLNKIDLLYDDDVFLLFKTK